MPSPLMVARARAGACAASITGAAIPSTDAANCIVRACLIRPPANRVSIHMRTLLLFDSDGTLILSGRAGLRARDRVFEEATGVAGAFNHLNAAGRTDGYLLEEASRRARIDLTPDLRRTLQTRYCEVLKE